MLTPGPDHPITVEPAKTRWRAYFNNHVIADSANAVVLQESNLPQVVYFPKADVAMEYFARTDRATHCPYKGDASYYTLRISGEIAENVAWSYEDAAPSVGSIAGHIAFYADRVEVYPVDDATVNPHHHKDASDRDRDDRFERDPNRADLDVDEVVRHTDAGDGTTQGEHWAPNVEGPTPSQGTGPDGGLR